MKLLFVCGATVTNSQLNCASWIKSIISAIGNEFEVTIASTDSSVSDNMSGLVGKVSVLIIPFSLSKPHNERERLLIESKPDVILVFGTETPNALKTVEICKNTGLLDRTAIFAQGLCCVCAKHYAEGLPERIVRRYTFRDVVRRQNILKEQQSLEKRAEYEKLAMTMAQNFIGRTTMDNSILRLYNPTANYFKCNDVLRNSFYSGQWMYNRCEKHRIFISQYYYPLKGFHYLIEAAAQLKSKYPRITIAAAGYNPIQKSMSEKELKDSSYIRYIKTLVKKYGLSDNIELLGPLSEEQMKEEYLKANVFVMPSTIENSPNSLAEAMMLGVPTIASDVGGVTNFAKHQEEAYIYPSSATYLLAYYLDKVFSDKADAEIIGNKGKMRAEIEYNRENNIKRFEEIMSIIAKSG